MTNKQLNEEHSMNHEQKQEEVDRRVAELEGLIVDQAMAMHTEAVAAGDRVESSDPSESFLRGVEHGVRFARAMMMM